MFFVKHLECVYGDTKNPYRNTTRDRVREIDCHAIHSLDQAREIILSILARYGGVKKLSPKILTSSQGVMWIECESPFQTTESNGVVDLKCLAFQVEFKEIEGSLDVDYGMKTFANSLGPNFFL